MSFLTLWLHLWAHWRHVELHEFSYFVVAPLLAPHTFLEAATVEYQLVKYVLETKERYRED